MSIGDLQRHWEELGRRDPLWAVLTEADRDGGTWEIDAFLATGREALAEHFAKVEAAGVEIPRGGRALDFGCGAGRMTQALAERFDHVDGVDIAAPMIERARAINQRGERCRFHVNTRSDLSMFDDGAFDLVYSVIVLQHMEQRHALAYIREFVRLLAPGGLAVFQIPSEPAAEPPVPLPAAAWRADVAVDDPPARIGAGESAELTVHVRNASPVRWPAEGELLVGAHWRTEDGTLVKIGAGRTALPGALEPGESVTLPLSVRAPNSGARRILEVDVFQERTAWFRDRGSTPFQATVELSGGSAEEPTGDPGFEPWIAMYSTPRSEVEGFVDAAGGEVVRALPDHSAGDAFESYMYVVRRTGVPSAHRAVERVSAVLKAMPRGDLLPPLTSNRSGNAARAELWIKGKIARATKWFTIAQLEHDQAVESALTEIEAALLAQETEIKKLRAELEAERRARSSE